MAGCCPCFAGVAKQQATTPLLPKPAPSVPAPLKADPASSFEVSPPRIVAAKTAVTAKALSMSVGSGKLDCKYGAAEVRASPISMTLGSTGKLDSKYGKTTAAAPRSPKHRGVAVGASALNLCIGSTSKLDICYGPVPKSASSLCMTLGGGNKLNAAYGGPTISAAKVEAGRSSSGSSQPPAERLASGDSFVPPPSRTAMVLGTPPREQAPPDAARTRSAQPPGIEEETDSIPSRTALLEAAAPAEDVCPDCGGTGRIRGAMCFECMGKGSKVKKNMPELAAKLAKRKDIEDLSPRKQLAAFEAKFEDKAAPAGPLDAELAERLAQRQQKEQKGETMAKETSIAAVEQKSIDQKVAQKVRKSPWGEAPGGQQKKEPTGEAAPAAAGLKSAAAGISASVNDSALAARMLQQKQKEESGAAVADVQSRPPPSASLDPQLAARMARQREKEQGSTGEAETAGSAIADIRSQAVSAQQMDPQLAARLARQQEKQAS